MPVRPRHAGPRHAKLKDAKDPNMYRAVYGDLSVKDVAAKDLPLLVGP